MNKWNNMNRDEQMFDSAILAHDIGINTIRSITQPLDDKIWSSIIDQSGHILIWDSMTGVFHGSI